MSPELPTYDSLAPGIVFADRYELVRTLGQGGFAKVFLANDRTLEIPVALKVLNPALALDDRQLKRFKREVIVARKITHKNVCKIYDIGQLGDMPYLTMEYIDGQELYGILVKRNGFPLRQGLGLCFQIASALDAAHREGVVHRDLKPHNIIVDRKGTAKILDFGIARFADTTGVTDSGMMMGTPNYMSPEQCRGEQGDQRSDLYSFGVLMYQVFTGSRPFSADTPLAVLYLHLHTAPRPPLELQPGLPLALNELILKCLAKDPQRRYQTAREVVRDLQAVFREAVGSASAHPREDTPSGGDPEGLLLSQTPPGSIQAPEPTPRGDPGPDTTVPTKPGGWITPKAPASERPEPMSAPPGPAAAKPDASKGRRPASRPRASAVPEPEPAAAHEPRPKAAHEPEPEPEADAIEPEEAEDEELEEVPGRGLILTLAGLGGALLVALAVLVPALLRSDAPGPAPLPTATPQPVPRPDLPAAASTAIPAAGLASTGTPAVPRKASDPEPAPPAVVSASLQAPSPAPPAAPQPSATSTPRPTDTPQPSATSTPRPTDTPQPSATPMPTDTPQPSATPMPTDTPTSRPTDTPTQEPSPTPRPPRARPTAWPQADPPAAAPARTPRANGAPPQPAVRIGSLVVIGAPADAEICLDGRPVQASRQGPSFVVADVAGGFHTLSVTSRRKGAAEKVGEVPVDGSEPEPVRLREKDWKAPRFRVSLKTSRGETIPVEYPVNLKADLKLPTAETVALELRLETGKLRIRRADGRELEKLCAWPETGSCGTLPPLNCGTVPLP
jgi:serine/threonine protein kinase/outer membrane biosynthesis protein TonB